MISFNNLLFSGDSIYLEHALKRRSVNSFLTVKFDKCGKNKHDVISRKLSKAQEKVRGTVKTELMKWPFCFNIIKLRFQLRYYGMNNL